jgi:hypothetical protein
MAHVPGVQRIAPIASVACSCFALLAGSAAVAADAGIHVCPVYGRRRGRPDGHARAHALQRGGGRRPLPGRSRPRRDREAASRRRAHSGRDLSIGSAETVGQVRNVHPDRVSDALAGAGRVHRCRRGHPRPSSRLGRGRPALHRRRLDAGVHRDRQRRRGEGDRELRAEAPGDRRHPVTLASTPWGSRRGAARRRELHDRCDDGGDVRERPRRTRRRSRSRRVPRRGRS